MQSVGVNGASGRLAQPDCTRIQNRGSVLHWMTKCSLWRWSSCDIITIGVGVAGAMFFLVLHLVLCLRRR